MQQEFGAGFARIRLPQFKGKRNDNPDTHVNEFDTVCTANGQTTDMHKLRFFPCTLRDAAMEWYIQYEQGHFATWSAMRNAFLIRFRQEKTPVQLLQKLYKMKQAHKEPVDEYAGRLRTLYKRLDEDSKPTRTMLIGWFVAGLRREYRGIISLNAQDLNSLDEAVELASRVERNMRTQKKGGKKHKELRSTSSSEDDSEEVSSSSDSDSDTQKKSKRKSNAKMKNVEALMTKLTTGGSTSTYRPGVYCPRCANEGHTKEECKMNDKYCAICITTNNHTT